MTDDSNTPDATAADDGDSDRLATWDYAHPDPVLATFASMANTSIGLAVTVNCGGRVVSGVLRSGADWLEALADSTAGFETEDPETGTRVPLGDRFRKEAAEWRAEWSERPDRQSVHLHMIDAWNERGHRIGLWRGRLIEVSDWSVGAPDYRED